MEPSRQPGGTSARRRRAVVFGPLLVMIGLVVVALGVPWQLVAGALGLFVLWLVLDG